MELLLLIVEMIILSAKASRALKWLDDTDHSFIRVIPGESQEVDCRLDDTRVQVVLFKQEMRGENKTKLIPNGNKITQSGQKFTIAHFRSDDDGYYYCKVESPSSLSDKQYEFKMDDEFSHKVWSQTEPVCLKGPLDYMDSVKVKCHTENRGPVTWFKIDPDSGDFMKINDNIEISQDYSAINGRLDINATLMLTNVTRLKDAGTYVCSKNNGYNNTRNISVQIFVQDPAPPTFLEKMDVHEGQQSANYTCKIVGSPRPEVTWLRGNQPIGQCRECTTKSDYYSLTWVDHRKCGGNSTHWDSTLTIQDSLLWRNSEQYTCIARNQFGENKMSNRATIGRSLTSSVAHVTSSYLNVMVTMGVILVLIVLIIVAVLYRRKKLYGGFYIFTLPPMPDYIKNLDSCKSLLQQTHRLPYDPEWEFPRDRLQIGRRLGSGMFGQVFLADAIGMIDFNPRERRAGKGKSSRPRLRFGSNSRPYLNNNHVTKVAVKMLKESSPDSAYQDLLSELKILIHVGEHKNIVNLLGACTKGGEYDLRVIIEYCEHGNLREFLIERRSNFEPSWAAASTNPVVQFSSTDLVTTALQVTRAMEFLASRRCVHRDLAARNVLVGANYVMKVADFGLARDICKENQYVRRSSGLLPIKWVAIEALVDSIYTHLSDVWSFGVLLWELFTLGGGPYPDVPLTEIYQYLVDGHRMGKPRYCPDEIYQIMTDCWRHRPEDRPSFQDIVESLSRLLSQHTTKENQDLPTTPNKSMHSVATDIPTQQAACDEKIAQCCSRVTSFKDVMC